MSANDTVNPCIMNHALKKKIEYLLKAGKGHKREKIIKWAAIEHNCDTFSLSSESFSKAQMVYDFL